MSSHYPQKVFKEKCASVRNWQNRKYRVFQRDGWKCVYCPKEWSLLKHISPTMFWMLNPEERPTVDHVTPISKGGNNKAKNLVTACFECNEDKASEIIKL